MRIAPPLHRPLLLPVLALVLGSCAAPEEGGLDLMPDFWAMEASLPEPQDVPQPEAPVIDTTDGSDWIRLSSGEWLRGEIEVFDREVLDFDSEELDDLQIDWDDVVEIRTTRDFTLVLEGQVEVIGVLRMLEDRIFLTDEAGTRELARRDVYRMIPGKPSEANYWSGNVAIGMTGRSGNTDQIDITTSISVLRRTARSRFTAAYDAAYGKVQGVPNTDNQRLRSQYDWYLGSRLYVTPLGVELYRDRFQNIRMRASPFTGLGYTLVDTGKIEWDVNAGIGYRYTRFDSVEAGEDDSDGTGQGIVATVFSWDPTGNVEIDADYSAQIGLEDTTDTNQSATLGLSVDLWWDLDLDVKLRWDRVGLPQPDSDGNVPEKDDYRLTVGLSWEF